MHRVIALSTGWLCAAAAATGVSWTAIQDVVGTAGTDPAAVVQPTGDAAAGPLDAKALETRDGVTVWPPRDAAAGTPRPTATGSAVSGGADPGREDEGRPREPTTRAPRPA